MSWFSTTHVVVAPLPALTASSSFAAGATPPASHGARRKAKANTWCSSSGRVYDAASAAGQVGLADQDPAAARSRRRSGASAGRPRGPPAGCRPAGWRAAASAPPWPGGRRSGSPAALNSPCATSMRRPSTPRSNQNRSTSSNIGRRRGSRQFQSGCSGANRCRYHSRDCRPARVTRVQAGPPNTLGQLFGGSRRPGRGPAEVEQRPLRAARARPRGPPGTAGARSRRGWGRGRPAPAGRGRARRRRGASNAARSPNSGSTSQ